MAVLWATPSACPGWRCDDGLQSTAHGLGRVRVESGPAKGLYAHLVKIAGMGNDDSTLEGRVTELEEDSESSRVQGLQAEVESIRTHQSDIEDSIEELVQRFNDQGSDVASLDAVEQIYTELNRIDEEMAELKQKIRDLTEDASTE